MATTKVVNYTAEQTESLINRFNTGESVESLAEAFGKTTRSIVAKLSREGVYVAKAKTKGEARVKKEALVAQIANVVGVSEEEVGSLEKATASALALVLNALLSK